jgi:hypothetical protein
VTEDDCDIEVEDTLRSTKLDHTDVKGKGLTQTQGTFRYNEHLGGDLQIFSARKVAESHQVRRDYSGCP